MDGSGGRVTEAEDRIESKLDLLLELMADTIRLPEIWRPPAEGACDLGFRLPNSLTPLGINVYVKQQADSLGIHIRADDGTILWVRWLQVEWVPDGQPWMPAYPVREKR